MILIIFYQTITVNKRQIFFIKEILEDLRMVVNTNLDIVNYMVVVSKIVEEYFDKEGNYQPHIGKLNVMRWFYNICVKESKFDEEYGHEITEALDLKDIVADEEFISEFNKALSRKKVVKLDFTNAYYDAMEIVNVRKQSFGNAVEIIKNHLAGLVNEVTSLLDEETINSLANIADKISSGMPSDEAVAKASLDEFREISPEIAKNVEKVIPIE